MVLSTTCIFYNMTCCFYFKITLYITCYIILAASLGIGLPAYIYCLGDKYLTPLTLFLFRLFYVDLGNTFGTAGGGGAVGDATKEGGGDRLGV